MKQLLAVLLALLIGTPPTIAQNISGTQSTDQPIKVEVQLVDVYVTVTDSENGPSTFGLERENFRLFEDGEEQEIAHFGSGNVPLRTCVVTDTSGSMMPKVDKVREAFTGLMKISEKFDEFALVAFTKEGEAELISSFTNAEEIQNKIVMLQGGGRTPFMDGIYACLAEVKEGVRREEERIKELRRTISDPRELDKAIREVKKKNAVIVISDGGENHSRYSENDIKDEVRELDVQIYGIGIYEPDGYRPSREEEYGPTLLRKIAGMTGGRVLSVEKLSDLPQIVAEISASLKEQYHLQYYPANAKKKPKREGNCPDYRKILVKVKPPDGMPALKWRTRAGYCNPQ